MEILKGHVSPETAYQVDDYPYGYTLRCKIRYWLEYKPNHGVRFMSQTTNPRRNNAIWNKPKGSTYCRFGGCMYLDEKGHVHWTGLTEYCSGKEAQDWSNKYREGMPPEGVKDLDRWVAGKVAYDKAREGKDYTTPLSEGLAEAHKAMREVDKQ